MGSFQSGEEVECAKLSSYWAGRLQSAAETDSAAASTTQVPQVAAAKAGTAHGGSRAASRACKTCSGLRGSRRNHGGHGAGRIAEPIWRTGVQGHRRRRGAQLRIKGRSCGRGNARRQSLFCPDQEQVAAVGRGAAAIRAAHLPEEPNPPVPRCDAVNCVSSHSMASYRAITICAMRSPAWMR